MRHTNQQPFRFHLRQPAQQKLPKATHMFDLGKDRFDDHFSSAEHFTTVLAGQLVPHPFLQRRVCWQRGLLLSLEGLTLIWWHVQIDRPISAEHFTTVLAGQLVPHPFLQRRVCWQRGLLLSLEGLTLIWWHVQIDRPHG